MRRYLRPVEIGYWLSSEEHAPRDLVAHAQAAEAAGFRVPRLVWDVLLFGGALAGLGGAVELMGVTGTLSDSFSPGWGYTAIAVALLGGLQPVGVALAALLFGALDAEATHLLHFRSESRERADVVCQPWEMAKSV